MELKKILGNIGLTALGTVAPPFGGMAAGVLRNVFDLKEDANEKDIIQAIEKATPEQILELKKADQEFNIKMKELGIDVIKLDKLDTQNARSHAKDNGLGTIFGLSLFNAALVLVVAVGTGYLLYFGKLANLNALEASILTLIIREAYGRYEQVCNFFFGSSHGSKQKTELMDRGVK